MPPGAGRGLHSPGEEGLVPHLYHKRYCEGSGGGDVGLRATGDASMRAEATTATFAGPPRYFPAIARAKSLKNSLVLVAARKAPKRMNMKT